MTVYKVNGIWRYRFMLKGKRYFKALPECRYKPDAEAAEAARKLKILQGRDHEPDCGTNFRRFVEEEYLPYIKASKSPVTYSNYAWRCTVLIEAFGEFDLSEVTTARYERFKRDQMGRTTIRKTIQAPGSVNQFSMTLASIFTRAEKLKLIDRSQRPEIERLKEDNERIRYITREEEARLRQAAKAWPYLDDMLVVYLATGMRRQELFQLKKQHVDFDLNVISVLGKGSKLRRIPLDPAGEARAILKRLAKESTSAFLFTSHYTGRAFTAVTMALASACQDAGIDPPVTLHVLRHTFCTRLAAAGVDVRTIQALAGHSSITTTMRYTHLVESKAHEAIRTLSRYQDPEAIPENNVLPFRVLQA